jgi:hypothetical protein
MEKSELTIFTKAGTNMISMDDIPQPYFVISVISNTNMTEARTCQMWSKLYAFCSRKTKKKAPLLGYENTEQK